MVRLVMLIATLVLSFNPDDFLKILFSFINTNKSPQNKKKSNQEFNFSGDDNFSFLIEMVVREEILRPIITKMNLQNN